MAGRLGCKNPAEGVLAEANPFGNTASSITTFSVLVKGKIKKILKTAQCLCHYAFWSGTDLADENAEKRRGVLL